MTTATKINTRSPETLVKEIYQQSILAERLGFHSAWIGEHHFNLLGANPCPNMLLAQLAGATQRIRLGPAVVILPLHHPLHVAEEWATLDLLSGGRVDFAAGRGFDSAEYRAFGADFHNSQDLFAEGMEIIWKAWTETGRWSHHGKCYDICDIEVRPKPFQNPLRPYVACFSRSSMELAARNDWNIIFAPFAASMVFGSLAGAVETYGEVCRSNFGRLPRRSMCSYFIHIADDISSGHELAKLLEPPASLKHPSHRYRHQLRRGHSLQPPRPFRRAFRLPISPASASAAPKPCGLMSPIPGP